MTTASDQQTCAEFRLVYLFRCSVLEIIIIIIIFLLLLLLLLTDGYFSVSIYSYS